MPAPAPADKQSLWRNISFLLMWSSVAASGFGDRLIQLAAEPMLGVKEPGASAAQITAGIMFFFFLPYMGLTAVGGWLADRLPRKWIMFACDQGRALVLLIAFFMAAGAAGGVAIPVSHHWKIYLIMFATGCFAAVFNPSKLSTLPQILPPHHLQPGNAVLAGIALIASLIGLAVGGPIIEGGSVRSGILLGVLAYGISGWFFPFLRIKPRPVAARPTDRPGIVRQLIGAVAYMRRHQPVRELVILNVLFWSAAWIVNAAVAALNRNEYGFAPDVYLTRKSIMLAMVGGGMLAGSFVVLWLRTRRESIVVALAGLCMASVAMILLAVNRSYAFGLVLAIVIGLFGGVLLICVDTLTQLLTPNYIRGRVFGMRALMNTASAVVVNFIIWQSPNADRRMIPALLITGILTGLVAVWGLWSQLTTGPAAVRLTNVMWRINRLYALVWHRLSWRGLENIPAKGPVILVANHTAGVDPCLLQAMLPRVIRWVMITPYRHRLLNVLWRAIRPIALEPGRSNRSQLRSIITALKQGEVVGLFPEGRLQRDVRELRPFEPGIGMLAARSGATIVPIWIEGTPSTRHMLWHFLCPSRTRLTVGRPYQPAKPKDYKAVADELHAKLVMLSDAS